MLDNYNHRLMVAMALRPLDNDTSTLIWKLINTPDCPGAPRRPIISNRPSRKILDRLRKRGRRLRF